MLYIYAVYICYIYMLYIYAIYIYAIYICYIYIYVKISLFEISCFLVFLRYPATRVATGKDGFKKASTARMQLAHQFHGRVGSIFHGFFHGFFT